MIVHKAPPPQLQASFRDLYRKGALDDREIDVEVPLSNNITPGMDNAAGVGMMAQVPSSPRRLSVCEFRKPFYFASARHITYALMSVVLARIAASHAHMGACPHWPLPSLTAGIHPLHSPLAPELGFLGHTMAKWGMQQ